MKKPPKVEPIKGEYIPKDAPKIPNNHEVLDSVGKLSAQHVFEISQSLIGLANNVVVADNERQKTAQARLNASVRQKELDVQNRKNAMDHAVAMQKTSAGREEALMKHEETMKMLNSEAELERNRQKNIQNIFRLIESGVVSIDEVVRLIGAVDSRR